MRPSGQGPLLSDPRLSLRYYGAPIKGPPKALLKTHERYLRKTLGPIHQSDPELLRLLPQISSVAFDPRPIHFGDGSRRRWATYEACSGQSLRIRQCHPEETIEDLGVRLWWSFLTAQAVDLSGVYVHQDRHHLWTSVVRLMLTDGHRQKPSSHYVDYLKEKLNTLLSGPTAHWLSKVEL